MTRTQREPRVLSLVCPTGGGYITSHAEVTFSFFNHFTHTHHAATVTFLADRLAQRSLSEIPESRRRARRWRATVALELRTLSLQL